MDPQLGVREKSFETTKNDSKSVIVKILHLSKKVSVPYHHYDLVYHLIKNIQTLLKDYKCNFGIFLKNKKSNTGKFIMENVHVFDIAKGEYKIIYTKKYRVFNFDIPNIKRLKIINNKHNQELFVKYITNGNLQNVMEMLSNGFDPNYIIHGEPPIHYALLPDNCVPLITLLISQGAHIDYRSIDYQTILHKAVKLSKSNAVKIILEMGLYPDVLDAQGLTPLYLCVQYNNDINCFETLLEYQSSKTCIGSPELTLLQQACFNNRLGHAEVLVRHGEDINIQSNDSGNSALHFAVLGKSKDCISYLLNIGVNINLKNKNNVTAYEMAETYFPEAIYLFSFYEKDIHVKEEFIDKTNNIEETGYKEQKSITRESSISCSVKFSTNKDKDTNDISNKKEIVTEDLEKSFGSHLSLVQVSVFSSDIECKEHFKLGTKVVEFKRSSSGGFGFSLETKIDDYKDTKRFVPTYTSPSIHRICKWKVLSSMMTLFSKPYLLEVNQVYVGNMPHKDLVALINSVQDKIILKITKNIGSQSDTDCEIVDLTSNVSSVGKLDDSVSLDLNFINLKNDNNGISERDLSTQNGRNIQMFGFDNDNNDLEQFDTLLSIPQMEISIYPSVTNIVHYKNACLNFTLESIPLNIINKFHNSKDEIEINEKWRESRSIDNKPRDFSTENCHFTSIETPLPQDKFYRTELVLSLKKSLNKKCQIHIPLKIN